MQPRAEGLIPKKNPVGEPRSVVSIAVRISLRPRHTWGECDSPLPHDRWRMKPSLCGECLAGISTTRGTSLQKDEVLAQKKTRGLPHPMWRQPPSVRGETYCTGGARAQKWFEALRGPRRNSLSGILTSNSREEDD